MLIILAFITCFFRCLCNLNARFTPIFLKITRIPHLLMFCRIKRKIKQGKGKKLRRKNLLFRFSKEVCQGEEKASLCKQKNKPRVHLSVDTFHRGEESFRGKESFTEVNEVLIRRNPWVCLGEGRLSRLKTPDLHQGEEHRARTTKLAFLTHFWPIFQTL